MNQAKFSGIRILVAMLVMATLGASAHAQSTRRNRGPQPPAVGDKAKNFRLRNFDGAPVELNQLTHYGPVTVVFLRGYPNEQSAICRSQFKEFIAEAENFEEMQSSVVFVYPGDRKDLAEHARDFAKRIDVPRDFYLVVDSDFGLTNAYGLRWNFLRETAYPCTMVIDRKGTVRYVKTSNHHGGRSKPQDVLSFVDDSKLAFRDEPTRR